MIINDKEIIWAEKYRPQRIEDLILPDEYLKKFKTMLENPKNILLVSSNPGLGKTSTANAIVKESGMESLYINASLDSSIDVLRGKIKQFASTSSFDGRKKIVILDEADGFSENSHSAMKGMIEEFSSNCLFISTCNYINKIPEPIVNRFEVYDFDKIFEYNKNIIFKKIIIKLIQILKNENVEFNQEDIVKLVDLKYPSIRGMLMLLQSNTIDNKLQLSEITLKDTYQDLLDLMKSRNFELMIKKVYEIVNPDGFYTWLFNHIDKVSQKPQVILTIAKYQFQSANVRDKNLNLGACCVEIVGLI